MSVSSHVLSRWSFHGGMVKTPLTATVPGHVHLDLVAHGVIGDPFYRMMEAGAQWVDETDWTYETTFVHQPNDTEPRTTLHFKGLDTVCDIFLNEELIASHDNMFVPLQVEITDKVKNGENHLRILFRSALVVGRERREKYFAANDLNPVIESFDPVAFVRKAQYMSGWDWGPRLISCGIWQPVELLEHAGDLPVEEFAAAAPMATLVRKKDEIGESFDFYKDGKLLWVRGANWIPDNSFPGTITREQLRRRLDQCVELRINMLRVWGGGLYETDDFYELCLERGILIWQDFPFACSYYPDDEEAQKAIEIEAIAAIKRLRRFPNLVIWCGNNENHSMFYENWQQGEKRPPRYFGEPIYEELLPRLVAEYDPGRAYIPSSPIGGDKPNDNNIGDQHNWFAWHWKGDWRFYTESTARFCSEFGFASSPSMATWRKTLGPKSDYDVRSDAVVWHDKTRKGTETFIGFVELHYPESKSLEEWVYYSQLNQRDALRHAIEHYRRSSFCTGTLIWQLNDCWPVQSWAVIDSSEHIKVAGQELKRLHHDWLISLDRQEAKMNAHVINDGLGSWTSVLKVNAYSLLTGEILKSWDETFTVEAGERKHLLTADLTGLNVSQTLIFATAGERSAWKLLAEPKHAELNLPAAITAIGLKDANLTLQLSQPVVDLVLTEDGDPSAFGENGITVPTADIISIPMKRPVNSIEFRSLAGVHPTR